MDTNSGWGYLWPDEDLSNLVLLRGDRNSLLVCDSLFHVSRAKLQALGRGTLCEQYFEFFRR